jgi:hypothetical protein
MRLIITKSNYVVDANSATVYSNIPTTSPNLAFYWVDGGSKQVKCTVVIAGKERTPAGMIFRVTRPLPTFYSEVRETVHVGTNFGVNGQVVPGFRLQFGVNTPGTTVDAGIAYVYTNAPTNPETGNPFGRYFITQVIETFRQQYTAWSVG